MNRIINWLLNPLPYGRASILILRLMAGAVFFWEGILKFVYPNQGVGRFTKLGFPFPETTAHFVATAEIIGGLLIMAGLFTRLVALYFTTQMIVAILTTKIGLYLGTSPLPLPPALPKTGFWAVLHEIRSDYAQVLVSLFLLVEGAGWLSLDGLRRSGLRYRLKTSIRKDAGSLEGTWNGPGEWKGNGFISEENPILPMSRQSYDPR